MSQRAKSLRGIPRTTWRRLRSIPTYFFLIWRWAWWFYAFAWIMLSIKNPTLPLLLSLGITFIQSLVVTLYAPVFKIFMPRLPWQKTDKVSTAGQRKAQRAKRKRSILGGRSNTSPPATDEEPEILPPLARSNNPYRDFAIYSLDVIICGLVMYFTAYISSPPFGNGSPFYRYGFSTIFVAAFAYGYRGGLAAALGFDLFVLLGLFFPPPMAHPYVFHIHELLGSLLDAPLIAILTAYMATLLNSVTRSKRHEQDSVRRQRALLRVSETLVSATGASDRQRLLQQSVKQIRQGGHFGYLIIAIITYGGDSKNLQPQIDTYMESGLVEEPAPAESEALVDQVAQTGERLIRFEREEQEEPTGIARLYLPFKKEGQVYMVLGAASERQTPFEDRQENFLKIVGTLLVVALENMRLTEQAADLATTAERGRIAREIHDGIAQLIYMLSLNSETCATLLQRIADASTEEARMLAPVAERLDKVVTISKQALWETRHYMFTLKPLMSGTTTLTQMLTNQLREFEAISGLPAYLEVEGIETSPNGDQRRARKIAQVGTAIFRITQEALTNTYKHAGASRVQVHLHHLPQCIEVEISDDGKGLQAIPHSYDLEAEGERQRIYSGHGMRGMRERAEELGGVFEVGQSSAGGTSILARIPI